MIKTKLTLSSTAFITLISAYFSFILNTRFWQFAFEKVEINSFSVALFAFSLPFFIFIPLFWFFSLIVLPRIGKPLVVLFLLLSASANYALQNLGIIIDSDMIRNFAETNVREAKDFFTLSAFLHVFITGIIPSVLVCRTTLVFQSFKKELRRRFFCFLSGLFAVGAIASVSYKEYASFGRNNKQVRYYVNTFNYIYAAGRYYKKNRDAKRGFVILDTSPQLIKKADEHPRVVILIVGETARSQNFSLYGYKKETNPLLDQNNEIIAFKNVSSCGTATTVSLPCMFSALPRKRFNITDARYTQNLLDIIQAAGYNVFWKDNDDGCKKVCDRVNKTNTRHKNEKPYCFGDYCHDGILLAGLDDTLNSISKDTVIVLHTMGSHGPAYYKRYPDKFKRFAPACDTADLQDCTQEQIINSYDNTIVYTDYIISSAIDILKRHKELMGAVFYVSDHGESLGENNIYLHGLPYAIAPDAQKKVPMILWLSELYQKSLQINMSCLKEKAETKSFSHDNYFHSVLSLLSVKTKAYDSGLDIFDTCKKTGFK